MVEYQGLCCLNPTTCNVTSRKWCMFPLSGLEIVDWDVKTQ